MFKKGALTTQQIVLLIILIASFAVILYFFMQADLGGESEEEICRNSVVMKSHSSLPGDTELNCHRTYVCITADGSCEGMAKPEKREVENVNEIYSVLSQEMAECWWMFGAGKLDYVGKKALKKNYCSICSNLLFDDSLNSFEGIKNGRLSKDKFYEYMTKNNISFSTQERNKEKQTYSEYILGTNNLSGIKQEIASHENYSSDKKPSFGNITIGKTYYVVMGITSEISDWAWAGIGTLSAVGTFFGISNPVGWAVTGAIVAGTATGFGGSEVSEVFDPEIAAITVEGENNQFMAPTIVEVNSTKFKALNCHKQLTYA